MTDFEANRRHWKTLSREQRLALVFGVCADGITRTGQAPTRWDIGNAVGLQSPFGVRPYIDELVALGYLRRGEQGQLVYGDDCYLKTNGIPFHITPVKIKTPLE